MEKPAKKTISERNRTQTVTMTQTETLSLDLHHTRLGQFHHSQFLEITVSPDIVIALKKINLHSPVHQLLKRRKHPYIPFRNHISVFVPEVPDISKQIQGLRLFRKIAEKICKTTLPAGRISNLQTEMNV